jgi:hypothetical protein
MPANSKLPGKQGLTVKNQQHGRIPAAIGLGFAVGTAVGVATHNIAVGIGVGVALCVTFGMLFQVAGGHAARDRA